MLELSLFLLYACAFGLFVLERIYPAHVNGDIRKDRHHWYARAVLINMINLGVFFLIDIALLWCEANGYFVRAALLENLGFDLGLNNSPAKAAFVAYFIFTFIVYWWHRLRHSNNFLWRWFHQLHHSPAQIETLTAYYIHPLDLIANLLISNCILYLILGVDSTVAPLYTLITGLAGFLIHANINVPRAVGYVFQTPAMHRLHHKSGHHSQNFTDLVWWDMLFGTYHNPTQSVEQCGFGQKEQHNLKALLLGKCVKSS